MLYVKIKDSRRELCDMEAGVTIKGNNIYKVEPTAFIRERIRTGELIQVEEPEQPQEHSHEEPELQQHEATEEQQELTQEQGGEPDANNGKPPKGSGKVKA